MDLVRQILIAIEDHEHGFAPEVIEVPGYTEETVGYHVVLMAEAGLIRASDTTAFGEQNPSALPERLTWPGHEFIANARNETVWAKVKATVVALRGQRFFRGAEVPRGRNRGRFPAGTAAVTSSTAMRLTEARRDLRPR